MIKSFADRETEALFNEQSVRKLPDQICRRAMAKLQIIDNAAQLSDCALPPGNRLEALSGNRAGQHSIRVNDQWRICFRWLDGAAHEVEIVDYH